MKVITEADLPAIVAGILDGSLGQCAEASQHEAFAHAIAGVVADFCGGVIVPVDETVSLPLFDPSADVPIPATPAAASGWRAEVVANDSLPDNGGVWAGFGIGEIE